MKLGEPRDTTYLVFESALLSLFAECPYCSHKTFNITKLVIGSFIRITQKCDYCSKERYWTSQPFVNDTPLGNLLISAAILYTGSLPAKTLQFLKALKCATITPKTYRAPGNF